MSGYLTIEIAISDGASPALSDAVARLGDSAALHAAILPEAKGLSRKWLIDLASLRHETADRLGGTRTGELERAASKISGRSDASSATVEFGSPLLARAFRDVTIRPGAGKKFLTLPISGEAYGHIVSEFERDVADLYPRLAKDKKSGVLVSDEKGSSAAHYLLVQEVDQPRDPDLLPTDELYLDAAARGATTYLGVQWS